jgi:hypothetical protein
MKLLYSRLCSALATFVLIISFNTPGKAQPTVLVAGDIAFSGYIAVDVNPDQFSFVLLRNINATTVIKFSDYGWHNDVNALSNAPSGIVESEIVFTATTALTAGQEITIVGTTVSIRNPVLGSATAVNSVGASFLVGNLSLASNGDQIVAYQGNFPTPTTFIAGIHMNVNVFVNPGDPPTTTAAAWDGLVPPAFRTNNDCEKPPGLTTGTNANWFATEQDNVRLICSGAGGPPVPSVALARAALNSAHTTPANWQFNNINPPGFTLPSGCPYLSPIVPVTLISFTGKLNSDKTITLQWKVAAQQDIQEYMVEESTDGSTYRQLGSVAAGTGNTDTYSYTDMQVATGNNYYRLKTVELSGKIAYSNVIVINLKAGIIVSLYPNPVTDKLTIQQFGTIQNKTAVLLDGQGKTLQQIKLTNLQQDVSIKGYPAGVYIVKMEDGTVFKIVKQ